MSWNWSAISFITATICAILTAAWNAYISHKRLKLQEEAVRKGIPFYELKK
nr:MAG TPA: holin [Caudoviricetes sp.]